MEVSGNSIASKNLACSIPDLELKTPTLPPYFFSKNVNLGELDRD